MIRKRMRRKSDIMFSEMSRSMKSQQTEIHLKIRTLIRHFYTIQKLVKKVTFHDVQTVANYPSTDADTKPAESCFPDTIKAGRFDLKLYTKTNVASGKAGIITNAKSIDGRKVDDSTR